MERGLDDDPEKQAWLYCRDFTPICEMKGVKDNNSHSKQNINDRRVLHKIYLCF